MALAAQSAMAASLFPGFTTKTSCDAIRWLIDRDDVDGVVNVAAPHPLPNADFMRLLREASGASLGIPTSKWMLEIGAVFMRTETELILKSRRVIPARLLDLGFRFKFQDWGDAARDLCRQWKRRASQGRARPVSDRS